MSRVIVGKCANKILEQWPNVISIYIEAPREKMPAVHYGEKMQVSEKEADRLITKQISIVQNIINTIPVEITGQIRQVMILQLTLVG